MGVICLISALSYYDLTTFQPSEVYVAIRNRAYAPEGHRSGRSGCSIFAIAFYEPGIETISTIYGDVKIYNREKNRCVICSDTAINWGRTWLWKD